MSTPPQDHHSARPPSGGSDGEPTRVGPDSAGRPADVVPLGPSIEGYVLKEEVHRGGQGIVYRAIQVGTKREVALKVLLEGPFAGEMARRRFEREIELAASLRHPHIVTILDSGLSRGRYYFAMEYVDGLRLDRYVAQKRPPLGDTLHLLEQVCEAVNYAHQRGVIHRDLKPPNILVDAGGEPHILDFGLAKPLHTAAPRESTVQMLSMSGQLLGTVAYMSPEQAAGHQDVDVRSDVYSLGVVFYEALLGHPPYPVDGPLGEVLRRITQEEPLNPLVAARRSRSGFRINDELATILLKALDKVPSRRYQTAGDLARDLRHLRLGEPIEAKRASGLYMLKKTLRRYQLQAATAGLILVMLFAFVVTLAVLLARERDARRLADQRGAEARQAMVLQEQALLEARHRTAEATRAQHELRRALARQHIQRGDLALERSALSEARDSYWQAVEVAPTPAAMWALRRYYLQTTDDWAALAAVELRGPAILSPNAALAATCPTPDTVAVQRLDGSAPDHRVRAPGPVARLALTEDGALAAAGEGWAQAWEPGRFEPNVAAHLPEGGRPHALFVLDGGRSLLLVGQRPVRLFRGLDGRVVQTMLLRGLPAGPADFNPATQQLAIVTTAGIELISLRDDDRLTGDLVWSEATGARAIHFDGDRLVVLADGVYAASLAAPLPWTWRKLLDAGADFDLLDASQAGDSIALGHRGGRLALYRGGQLRGSWRSAGRRLEQVRLAAGAGAVVTLDDRALITRWGDPESRQPRRRIHDARPTTWAASANGATVLLAVERGQVLAFQPQDEARRDAAEAGWRTVLRPRLLGFGGDLSLAISADGLRAVVRDRTTLRFMHLPDGTARSVVWDSPATAPGRVALSGDGQYVAVLARTPTGDREQIVLRRWEAPEVANGTGAAPPATVTHDFVGALVRDMAFLPRTPHLLVLRSNGEVLRLEGGGTTPAASPWMQLDAPGTALACDQGGDYVAVACEDGLLRVVTVAGCDVRHRVPVSGEVITLSFNPRDDALLVRTRDGQVRVIDPTSGETVATWALPAQSASAIAAWIGPRDALLLGEDSGLYEYRVAEADAAVERNRALAREQQAARALAGAEYADAWAAATALASSDRPRGRRLQQAVLEAVLRRPRLACPAEWTDAVLSGASPATRLALGHAAYEGERFAWARQWLREATEQAGGRVDAYTLLRLAQCDYLAEDYARAADAFAEVLPRPDFDPAQGPQVALQRVAALWLAGRPAEARQAAARVSEPSLPGRYADIVASTYASVIARVITGIERESTAAALVDSLLGAVGERRVLFQDDEHFFAGELARQRGASAEAAVHYQRCIDLARDEWPANWARCRLGPPVGAAAGHAADDGKEHL
ncbi:MAG: serine/threonine-protein kinase [Planctomycetota bacterium]